MKPKIFSNVQTNQSLLENHPNEVHAMLKNRYQRRDQARLNFVSQFYPSLPLPLLSSLNHRISDLQQAKTETNDTVKIENIDNLISQIQTTIDEGNYSEPGNANWEYRQQWYAKAAEFQWPTAEETATRAQEEQELLNLLS